MSGAGKSTISALLAAQLRARGEPVEILDGDTVRAALCQDLGYSRADRDINIRRIAWVAALLVRHGVSVIVAAISPYREARDEARATIGRFLEVFVDCPMDELVRRDVKGLYARALRGEVAQFTGVSDPYEPPLAPEVRIDTGNEPVDASVARVLEVIDARFGSEALSRPRHGAD
jgi:adenylyl-sulfate kinase